MKWQVRGLTDIVKKYKKVIFLVLMFVIVVNILNILAPYLLKIIIDRFAENMLISSVLSILIGYILLRVAIIFIQYIKDKTTNKLSNDMLGDLRNKIFDKLIVMNMKTFTKFQSSDLYTRLTVDAENTKTLFSDNIPVIINDFLYILFIVIAMIIIDIKLSIIGITCIFIIGLYSFFIVKKLKKLQKITTIKRDLENQQYSENYNKSKLTRFFSLEKKNISKVNKLLDEELQNRYKYITVNSFLWPASVLLQAVGIYVIIYYVLNIKTSISLGTVYIFLYYIKQAFTPLKEMFDQLEEIQNAQVSLERINTVLSVKEKEDIKQGQKIQKLEGNIEFKNVTFAYGKKEVLNDISFKINKGEKVAFIGKTGAGKTTITNILMRLYPIKSGDVILDGYNMKDISIESVRNNITYISQNAYVFKDTIRRNILLEKQDISDEEILKIMKDIGAMPLLDRLENGLDEIVTINKLSKGELQIIAFIRAIVHKANIYIFDEPTSNIDLRTEKMIQSIIDKISKTSTVIIIAHRLATIQNVDKILKVENGKVSYVN